MRKFVVQSKRGEVSISEVEVEIVSPLDDPSVMWLKPGEYMARILRPTSFHMKHEKMVDGKREVVLTPDVWFSHSFFETQGEALKYAEKLIEHEFEFNLRKYGKTYTDTDIAAAFMAITMNKLTA